MHYQHITTTTLDDSLSQTLVMVAELLYIGDRKSRTFELNISKMTSRVKCTALERLPADMTQQKTQFVRDSAKKLSS